MNLKKTAWKRRLQLFELVLVLLLNVVCFSKLVFGPFCHQGAKLTYWLERLMKSGIVDVVVGSVVHGYFLVRSPVEKQQHEPGTKSYLLVCSHCSGQMILLPISCCCFGRLKSRREAWNSLWTWYDHRLTFGRLQLQQF